jgi:hypothetical protein
MIKVVVPRMTPRVVDQAIQARRGRCERRLSSPRRGHTPGRSLADGRTGHRDAIAKLELGSTGAAA